MSKPLNGKHYLPKGSQQPDMRQLLYLIGGRRINPVDVYDPATNIWTQKGPTPIELHHFQAVVYGDAIYIMGAMTGGWPNEKPLDRI